jgi:site-specific DNA-methyltransferase (adenine-specific)
MLKLIHGNCLEEMKEIESGSIDMVLADPPYGTTACKWDSIIHLELMWEQLNRVIKKNGAIVLTASQPFTTTLISSNMKMFKYCWVWNKKRVSNPAMAKKQPLRDVEDVIVFSTSRYYPQGLMACTKQLGGNKAGRKGLSTAIKRNDYIQEFTNYPRTLLSVSADNYGKNCFHPTQKPVALMEYLIKTYTNKNEIVLDFTMGSGSTGVACKNLNRNFIGIELDEKYFKIAQERCGVNPLIK